jgi:hypothetical protein
MKQASAVRPDHVQHGAAIPWVAVMSAAQLIGAGET